MKKEAITLDQIRDAIMRHWLRYGTGACVDDIVKLLGGSDRAVRAAIRATSARRNYGETAGHLEDACIPGFETVVGNRHYHTPVTWIPTMAHLLGLLRSEGSESKWLVKGDVIPLKAFAHGIPHKYEVIARTKVDALKMARELALKEYPQGIHDNSVFYAEWLGRHFPGTAEEVQAAAEVSS